jgi:hypothetical protein
VVGSRAPSPSNDQEVVRDRSWFSYTLREMWQAVLKRRKPPAPEPQVEVLPVFLPRTEVERAVYAALVLAGEPVNNRRLAELMRYSPAHASRCVAQLEGAIRKSRKGRDDLTELSLKPRHRWRAFALCCVFWPQRSGRSKGCATN